MPREDVVEAIDSNLAWLVNYLANDTVQAIRRREDVQLDNIAHRFVDYPMSFVSDTLRDAVEDLADNSDEDPEELAEAEHDVAIGLDAAIEDLEGALWDAVHELLTGPADVTMEHATDMLQAVVNSHRDGLVQLTDMLPSPPSSSSSEDEGGVILPIDRRFS